MAQHILGLHVPDILNECVLKIEDVSSYTDMLSFSCPLLQITPPGFTYAIHFKELTEGFNKIITAEDLEIGLAGDNLSDGVYVIRYSVAPNDKVFVEYNYLRVSHIMNKYYSILCTLDASTCYIPSEIEEKFQKLRDIRMLIDAAKAKVEYCHSSTEGMQLYNYALSLLNKLECKTC